MKRANLIGLLWALLMTSVITLNVATNAVQMKSQAGVKPPGGEEKIKWRPANNALVIQPVTIWPSQFAVA